jgi:perosamine synthetase
MVERFGYKPGDFPVTEFVADRTIALPFYNNLSRQEVVTVCNELRRAVDRLR